MTKQIRKIVHVDMDAFYASVEQRDNPALRGKPVAVGYDAKRGVVATASYEARRYGVHSALPISIARRLCPNLICVLPRFDQYRVMSQQIHAIFAEYTDIVEPLALDEAYLDVTENKLNISSAWTVAQRIRDKIYQQTGLTSSAGVSYNKFLAKSASDMRKPDGQYLITPEMGAAFIAALPVDRFHGIGPATAEAMHRLGIRTGADLRTWPAADLRHHFGKLGNWYYQIAQGNDDRPVEPHRERKSLSAETTFADDVFAKDRITDTALSLADDVWNWTLGHKLYGRTVTIKIRWADFAQATRSRTERLPVDDKTVLRRAVTDLIDNLFPITQGIRLVGVGVSNFTANNHRDSLQLGFEL